MTKSTSRQHTITHALAHHRSQTVGISDYFLHLDLSGAAERANEDNSAYARGTFPVKTVMVLHTSSPQLVVDYLGERIAAVRVNGVDAAYSFDGSQIIIPEVPTGEDIHLEITGLSRYSRTGQGLHRMYDTADGNTYLYSHLEPSDARRIYPCFDQPDLKARFHVKLTAPAQWTLLSNQPEVRREEGGKLGELGKLGASASTATPNGLTTVEFAPTPPLSTYLTAFAAGPYVGKYSEWNAADDALTVHLNAWARASMADYLDEEILNITAQGLDFYHTAYGYPYPWGKYDSIFVPEYNLGAMENPGLVTFTEHYLFRSTPTRAQHAARTNTILHEMAHMWFGDLVTPQWWDDLWLKESFAEFMGADAAVHATKYTENWTNFAATRKNWAYAQDQLPTTHPIKAEIPDVDAARQNFDGITYAKGAAVLKQLVHYVGRDQFYAGARDYFRAHAFGAATFEDLLTALKNHTDHDVEAWSGAWLRTSGVDTVTPLVTIDAQTTTVSALTLEVTAERTTRPHRVGVSFFAAQEADLTLTHTFDVLIPAGESPLTHVEVKEAEGLPAPAVVLVNDGDHTYAKVRFDEHSLHSIQDNLDRLGAGTAEGELSRAVIWTALWNMTRDGVLSTQAYVNAVTQHAHKESNSNIMSTAYANAQFAVQHYLPPEHVDSAAQHFAQSIWERLSAAQPGSDQQLVLTRAAIRALAASPEEGDTNHLRQILAGNIAGLNVDTDIRWAVLCALTARDATTPNELAEELQRDNTLTGAARYLQATNSWPRKEVKEDILHHLNQPGKYSNDEINALVAAFTAPGSAALQLEFANRYFAELDHIWQGHPIEIARKLVSGLYPETEKSLAATDAYLEKDNVPAALRRELLERQDTVARNLRVQQAQAHL